jgi:protein TonB
MVTLEARKKWLAT